MTEKEIVDYLKENRTKGVAFGFMPKEVRNWCKKNILDINFYNQDEGWKTILNPQPEILKTDIFSLPEDFKFESKPQSGWFEYEIDKNGNFYSADADDKDGRYYHWSEWNTCLANNKDNLIGFGGWQYPNNKGWYMSPLMLIDGEYSSVFWYISEPSECKPAIPSKIRFWREAE